MAKQNPKARARHARIVVVMDILGLIVEYRRRSQRKAKTSNQQMSQKKKAMLSSCA